MIEWKGNLNDDCKAEWRGMNLHAEEMDRNFWWWSVSNEKHEIIASSDDTKDRYKSGKKARAAAEKAAQKYMDKDVL